MKKTISVILTIFILLSLTACETNVNSVTDNISCDASTDGQEKTNENESESIDRFSDIEADKIVLSDLKDYVIVYPDGLADWRITDVYFLAEVIKNVFGFEIEVITDIAEKREHEIILGSTSRKTAFDEIIASLDSKIDYIIAAKDGDIILGGDNYWSDLRAIYKFINDYLGYNDIEDKYSTPKQCIENFNVFCYTKPKITIFGCNAACGTFTEKSIVRDMNEAGFNLIEYELSGDGRENFREFIKWCTVYEVFIMVVYPYFTEDYCDCPIIWGIYVWDEPLIENLVAVKEKCEKYNELYGEYGWNLGINMFGFAQYWTPLDSFDGFFPYISKISFDHYFGHSILKEIRPVLGIYERARDYAQRNNIEMWSYIESQEIKSKNQNTSKMFLWSATVALCFGAKGIMYFQYGDASQKALWSTTEALKGGALINTDFSRTDAWYDAKHTNEVLHWYGEMLDSYDYLGTYIENVDTALSELDSIYLESPYPFFDCVIEELTDVKAVKTPLLIGCYEKKEKDGYSFIIMNMEDLDSVPYSETNTEDRIKLKINGDNVKFYRDGKEFSVEKDADGCYLLEMANGFSWLVTVD